MDFFLKDSDDSSNEVQTWTKRKIVSILNKAGHT